MGVAACSQEKSAHIGVQVEFRYNDSITILHCQETDTLNKICKQFISKSDLNEKVIYYIYDDGNSNSSKFDKNLTFNQMANSLDKSRKKMNIIVEDSRNSDKTSKIKSVRAKNVICPKCYENTRIKINDEHKITLFDCKNNHTIEDISLPEFENTQMINLNYIICDMCKERNKADSNRNKFYKCYECNKNICPLCIQIHNKNHNLCDYDINNYECWKHKENFTNYCKNCKKKYMHFMLKRTF